MTSFETPANRAAEDAVARVLAQAWRCEIRAYGPHSAVDRYAVRGRQVVAFIEIKCRSHPATKYPTVFLAVQKYVSMLWAAWIGECPALYVVQFCDRLAYIDLQTIDRQGLLTVKGRPLREGAKNDQEPMIEIPVSKMLPVKAAGKVRQCLS